MLLLLLYTYCSTAGEGENLAQVRFIVVVVVVVVVSYLLHIFFPSRRANATMSWNAWRVEGLSRATVVQEPWG